VVFEMRSLVFLFAAFLLLAHTGCRKTEHVGSRAIANTIDAHDAFANARTESEKRDVVIAIFDAGLIKKWTSVESVDRIFGTSFYSARNEILPGRKTRIGVVRFSAPAHLPSDGTAAAVTGWYFAVEFDRNGTILRYYLSNAGK
jgi:hypothetical protein